MSSTTTIHDHELSASPWQASAARWRSLLAAGHGWSTVVRLSLGTCAVAAAAVLAVLTGS